MEIDVLRRAGFDPQWERVQTEEEYLEKLRPDLDLIISDYDMKGFNGFRTLELLMRSNYMIPFILVTGTVGEEKGAEIIRQGASDFVLKDRLHRLGTAAQRALKEGRENLRLKYTEAQLRWKTAFLEAKVHSSIDGILVVDSEGKKVLHNRRFIDLWHIPTELEEETDHNGRLVWMARQVREPRKFIEKVTELYAHPNEISQDEVELVDGTVLDRYSSPVRGKDGKHYGRIWSYRDITERKKAGRQIAEQAALLDAAQDGILVRDLEGGILFWNKGAERMYGWTREEAVGRNAGQLIYPDPERSQEINRLVLQQNKWSGEVKQLTKEGLSLTVQARWTLVRDEKGNPKSVLSINTDVTESKNVQAQLMRAQRMESLGTLAGGIAHDLNNILAPIVMAIGLLKHAVKDPQPVMVLETIEISANRGTEIVRQILSFARGEKGIRIEVQPQRLLNDLEKIIGNTLPKNIRLQFSIPAESWTISGDPTQLHQILLNLCLNARDAMPKGGVLTIGLENVLLDAQYAAMHLSAEVGSYVVISFSDTGTGISSAVLDKIFEPFFTTKEVGKGTGLGLSMVATIVKSHDGFVNVYSELGKGSTFKVYLPAMEAISGERKLPEKIVAPRGNGETILLVDDEAPILTVTGQTLEAYGYKTLTATNGSDALAIYARARDTIAAVVTDMAMPIMDGATTIRALMDINPAVKIVAVSGLRQNGVATAAAGCRAKYFLTKPFTAEALLGTLRTLLDE